MDPETELLKGLIELQYGQNVDQKVLKIANQVPWAKGWPEDPVSFWNAEAFMWSHKIEKQKRALIERELSIFRGGNNLDVGCGAYSYVPSTGLDFSPKMLQFNEQCHHKIIADMEQVLPLSDSSFDSITAIFVLNYTRNYRQLLQEVWRILVDGGKFVVVLSTKGVREWHRQKEVNTFSSLVWVKVLTAVGFRVRFYEKAGVWFFVNTKNNR